MNAITHRSARAWTAGLAALLAGLAIASPAAALPLFYAVGSANGNSDGRSGSGAVGAERRFDDITSGSHALGSALASPFGLRASASGRANNGAIGGDGMAGEIFDDVVVHGPAGPVTASFDLVLSGSMGALTHLTTKSDSLAQASAFVVVQTLVDGLPVTADPFFQDRVRLYSLNGALETQKTGMLSGWPGGNGEFGRDRFTTPAFTVTANEPFRLEIILHVTAGVFGFSVNDGVFSEAFGDFGSTLAFPTVGPVFHLPAGYSVESAGARIHDNAFVPAPGIDPGSPPVPGVPQPGSVALLAAGAAALVAWSRLGRGHPVRPTP